MKDYIKSAIALFLAWTIQAFTRWDIAWMSKLGVWSEGERWAFVILTCITLLFTNLDWRRFL